MKNEKSLIVKWHGLNLGHHAVCKYSKLSLSTQLGNYITHTSYNTHFMFQSVLVVGINIRYIK
jgi:hypothetical protein